MGVLPRHFFVQEHGAQEHGQEHGVGPNQPVADVLGTVLKIGNKNSRLGIYFLSNIRLNRPKNLFIQMPRPPRSTPITHKHPAPAGRPLSLSDPQAPTPRSSGLLFITGT